jgi:hypothetical protein
MPVQPAHRGHGVVAPRLAVVDQRHDLRVRVRKQGVVSFVAEQWKMHATMQIATAHGVIWACVLAGFYSVSGVDEVVLQRVARSASMPPKPPGAPLPDDA